MTLNERIDAALELTPGSVFDSEDEIPPHFATVFTNCNVCGIKLRTDDEDRMGMCERCASEGP